MTNINASLKDYHSRDVNFMQGAMKRFWVDDTLSLFNEMGILWKEEEKGKVYPYSDTASSVLDVLRMRVDMLGIKTECEFAAVSVKKNGNGFIIENSAGQKRKCDRVIIATGGKAGSSLGSDGSGYKLLQDFGHRITPLVPSLVQIKTDTEFVRKLKGIKVMARVTIGGREEIGELLFTDYGISGPPVFTLSAYLGSQKTVYIDIMPEYGYDDIYEMICMRCAYMCDLALEDFFVGMLNKRVGQAILKEAGIAPLSRKSCTLSNDEMHSITKTIKHLTLKVKGTASWNSAQVTKGGADVSQFDPNTMQSKLVKGLYACGEILDIDGDCGGYNLQWAWSSGYLAGKSASSNSR